MEKGNLENILESIMNENASDDLFRTILDPINIYVTGIENWEKYKAKFGEAKMDEVEEIDFFVLWDVDFNYKRNGIYGLTVFIERIYGTFEFKVYNEESHETESKGQIEFDKKDFEKMKLHNEPEFSEYNSLYISGLYIDFNRNRISIEYN